jgi:hypothetical protein
MTISHIWFSGIPASFGPIGRKTVCTMVTSASVARIRVTREAFAIFFTAPAGTAGRFYFSTSCYSRHRKSPMSFSGA